MELLEMRIYKAVYKRKLNKLLIYVFFLNFLERFETVVSIFISCISILFHNWTR